MLGILLSEFAFWPLLGCLSFIAPGRICKSVGISSLIVVFAMAWSNHLKPVLPVLPRDGFVFQVEGSVEEKSKSWSVLGRCMGIRDSSQTWSSTAGLLRLYLAKQLPKPQAGDRYIVRQTVKSFPLPLFPFEKDWGVYFTQKGIAGSAFVSFDRIRVLKKGAVEVSFFEKAQAHFVGLLERAFADRLHH